VVSSEGLVRSPNETIHEHLSVIRAISDRDSDAAENLMRLHFKQSIATIKKGITAESRGNRKIA
jgi:DNA-binding GntR family transcriptional regulator